MKYLKQKLIAATAMLMVSTVMLSSVSYAWFTLSTNPEVKGMKATVSANQNLEIALDKGYKNAEEVDAASTFADPQGGVQGSKSGDNYTWGNLIDLTKAFEYLSATQDDASLLKLQPVAFIAPTQASVSDTTVVSAGGSFKAPQYGADGRISKLDSLTANQVDAKTDAALASTDVTVGNAKGLTVYKDKEDFNAFSVAYWLRTNVAGDVSLSTATKRADDGITDTTNDKADATDPNNVVGGGSFIKVSYGSNTQQEVEAYLKHLKIVFREESATDAKEIFRAAIDVTPANVMNDENAKTLTYNLSSVAAPAADSTEPASTATGTPATVKFNQDEAKKIVMYVYIDGATITNADALLDDIGIDFNIQFKHSAITPGSGDGKTEGAMNGDGAAAAAGN